jgi:hypothetical protein
MDNARPEVITGTMEQETEVIVVGGGLNGPLLALALASGGVRSVVLDAGPRARVEDPGFDGRAYALAVGARRMLGALGLWDGLEPQAQPILEIKISDGRAGEGAAPLWLHFDHAEIEEGPMGHFLEDRFLRRALLEAAEASERIALAMGGAGRRPGGAAGRDRGHPRRRPPDRGSGPRRLRRARERDGGPRRHRADRLGLRPDRARRGGGA